MGISSKIEVVKRRRYFEAMIKTEYNESLAAVLDVNLNGGGGKSL